MHRPLTRRRPTSRATLREIAQYRSHADLLEISEILDRYPDSETVELRRVVTQQLAALG